LCEQAPQLLESDDKSVQMEPHMVFVHTQLPPEHVFPPVQGPLALS
jgi:hypothetical protein